MEALNWRLLEVARSEIGSNRKFRGNRFLTIIQYCLDMSQAFLELKRICRLGARLIFVIGRESTVRGTRIFNGEIVAEIACRAAGFDLILRQERVYVNRYGQHIFEDILHFTPLMEHTGNEALVKARDIAREVLESVYHTAPDDAKRDIKGALEKIHTIEPSPFFEITKARNTKESRGGMNEETTYPS